MSDWIRTISFEGNIILIAISNILLLLSSSDFLPVADVLAVIATCFFHYDLHVLDEGICSQCSGTRLNTEQKLSPPITFRFILRSLP